MLMKQILFPSNLMHNFARALYPSLCVTKIIKESLTENAQVASLKRKEWINNNRKSIMSLLHITLFLCRQNLAFRGHNKEGASNNRANFLELSKLFAKHDLSLAKILKITPNISNIEHRQPKMR